MKESIFALWGKRNPQYEIQYDETIVRQFCDYGKGTTQYSADKAKILGAGYEAYIIAFFIGLYSDKRIPLTEDKLKLKGLGQPIMYWGNQETRKNRKSYNEIVQYMFVALVVKTDIDILEVDKGKATPRSVVDKLIVTMEEYANYGFMKIADLLDENPNYFYNNDAFLKLFLSFLPEEPEVGMTWSSDMMSDDEADSLGEANSGEKTSSVSSDEAPDEL